jgi:hypothetical protein
MALCLVNHSASSLGVRLRITRDGTSAVPSRRRPSASESVLPSVFKKFFSWLEAARASPVNSCQLRRAHARSVRAALSSPPAAPPCEVDKTRKRDVQTGGPRGALENDGHAGTSILGRDLIVALPFYRFVAVLLAAELLAHRLRLAARTTRQHGGRWRWRWHVFVAGRCS